MRLLPTELPGVVVIEPDVHKDARGHFFELYHQRKFQEQALSAVFVQDNVSQSKKGVLRGLHCQSRSPQGKLIQVIAGEVYDVAVDIRKGSPTFGRWTSTVLSGDNFRQVYIPPGFSHGFCVLSNVAVVFYKCTGFFDPADEFSLLWNDADIGVRWPIADPILAQKDKLALPLKGLTSRLPSYEKYPDILKK